MHSGHSLQLDSGLMLLLLFVQLWLQSVPYRD
jgi:hypothetical protein